MLTEDDVRVLLHGELMQLLVLMQPHRDFLTAVREWQRRRKRVMATLIGMFVALAMVATFLAFS